VARVGIIGGSGFDDPEFFARERELEVDTPWGAPSSRVLEGKISGVEVSLVSRHGPGHKIMPGNVNYRANIHALKERGCRVILATTACGSLRTEIAPGFLVLPDQFIDRTTKRASTFYDRGEQVCHIAMEHPFCRGLRDLLARCAAELGLDCARDRTVITIEGPRFSTKAESKMFRTWGADIINMSTVPEVVLAREAGLCYQAIAMSTDYDCFMETKENVTWEQIVKTMTENVEKVTRLIAEAVKGAADLDGSCGCADAIGTALV
jgi:5'-methylthioadenosine phosphorylase